MKQRNTRTHTHIRAHTCAHTRTHVLPGAVRCPLHPTHPLGTWRGSGRGARAPRSCGRAGRRAAARPAPPRPSRGAARLPLRSAPRGPRLCSFMIGTRSPEPQPERREGSRACGGRGEWSAAPAPHAALALEPQAGGRPPRVQRQAGSEAPSSALGGGSGRARFRGLSGSRWPWGSGHVRG